MTAAEAILEFVANNDHPTTNDIIEGLAFGWKKSTIRNVLFDLQRHGKVRSETAYRPPAVWTLTGGN